MAQQPTNQVLAIIVDTKTFSNSHVGMSQYQNNNKPNVGVAMAMTDNSIFQKADGAQPHETNIDFGGMDSADKSPNSPSEEEKKELKIMSIKKRSFPYRYHQRARWARGVNSRTKRIADSLQFQNGQMAPSDAKENPAGGKAQNVSSEAPQAGPNYQQQSSHTFMSMWVGIASMFRSKSASETQGPCQDGVGNSICARIDYVADNTGSQNSPETDQSQTSPTMRLNVHPSQILSSQISASTLSECSTVRMETVRSKARPRGKSLASSGSVTVSKDESYTVEKRTIDSGQSAKREKRLRERGSPVDPKRLRLVLRSIQKHLDEEKKKVSGPKRKKSGAQKGKTAAGKNMKLQGSPTKLQEPFSGHAVHSIIKPSHARNRSPEVYLAVDQHYRSRSFDKKLYPGNLRGEERFEPIAIYRRNQSTPALAQQPAEEMNALAHIIRSDPHDDGCRGAPSTLCWMGDEFPIPPHYSPASHKRVQFNTSYARNLDPVGTRESTSLYPGKRPEAKSSSALAAKQAIRYKVGRALHAAPRGSPLKGLHHTGSSQVTYLQYGDRTQRVDNSSRSFPNLVKSSSDEAEKCIRKRITKNVSNPIYKRQRRSASQPDKYNVQYRSSPSSCSLLEF